MTNGGLELAEVIQALRIELQTAIDTGKDEWLKFTAQEVQVELSVSIQKTGGAAAGVKFWVIEAGMTGSIDTTRTSRITLTLQPVDATSNSPVTISGREIAGEK